ncbi:probable tRNA (uracil-O(2)-)-methyltransferase isoform X2 [Anoplophora glabripennis]|uniref:probable tRNA (uracil-O(2)-)-methyltransferase isoform X2 n=1 Tax=Anoplophora glabripennis TaxID=217634 RepID=UPI00087421EA|nr:probable tRNA (uracil-O(2)-)-methyltransferase isoform X2 [Anoplophora glabripennis]
MFSVPLVTSTTVITPSVFWDVVMLYHNRPHVVNLLYEMRKLKKLTRENVSESFLRGLLECYDKNVTLNAVSTNDFNERCEGIFISVRILISRKSSNECMEIVIFDKNENTATFLAVSEKHAHPLAPPFPYNVELTSSGNLRIKLLNFEDADTAHAEWIAAKLFPKLLKWTDEDMDLTDTTGSLSLISIDDYSCTYGRIKSKYGNDLVKEWPKKTNTDPKKYVFEDLAIASYLICLWRKYEFSDIKFVDCGCGNGLLVYILNKEGYKGYGVDIRRRPVWDIYPKETQLKVGTVTPSSVFANCTWIIGNHSDELTPWIPVIAMKSSPQTNIFVIPCCPYDFSGQKYARTNSFVSQYSDYFDYITNIYNTCGFDTKTDKLRIPSTKRRCLVGVRKKLSEDEMNRINSDVNTFIESRLSSTNFKARPNTEAVRNCTQLNRDLIHRLICACVNSLLVQKNYIKKANGNDWNKGSSLTIADLSKAIGKDNLKQLKEQCGGLQTLLRNHRYLFDIRRDVVYLREPPVLSEDTKKYKGKPCWFWRHHPDGCLHSSSDCSFKHGD